MQFNYLFCWEQITPSNSPLKGTLALNLYYDSKSIMWIVEGMKRGLFAYKDGKYIDFSQNAQPDFDILDVHQIIEDDKGNYIFYSKYSITVFNGKEWYNTPEKFKNNFILYSNEVFYHNNKIYLLAPYPCKLTYFSYDFNLNKYNLNDTNSFYLKNFVPDNAISRAIKRETSKDSLSKYKFIGLINENLVEINSKSQSWEYLKDTSGKNLQFNRFLEVSKIHNFNEEIFLEEYPNMVTRIDKKNNINSFEITHDLSDKSTISDIIYIPKIKGYFISKTTHLFYLDSLGKQFEIIKPIDISSDNWQIISLAFDGNKIWVGTVYGGIYLFTIEEIIKKIIPMTVLNTLLPSIDILNLYPNPIKNNQTIVEMVLEASTDKELKLAIYDIDGCLAGVPVISEHFTLNDYSKLVLKIPPLPKGLYFLAFENKKNYKAKAFIIE